MSAAAGCGPSRTRSSRAAAATAPATSRRWPTGRRGAARPPTSRSAAIAWGEPVLASAITTVRDGRLYYRGHDAVALARTATLEAGRAAAARRARPAARRGPERAGRADRSVSRLRRLRRPRRRRSAGAGPVAPTTSPSEAAQPARPDGRRRSPARGPGPARGGGRRDPRAPRPGLAGAARSAGTRSAARWCCWPTTSSTPRPSPPG